MSGIFKMFRTKQQLRLLWLGLDGAGKTTIMYRLKLGEVEIHIPTLGLNVERVNHEKFFFTVWDFGGRSKVRPLWRHLFPNTDALIFVVDSKCAVDFESAKKEIHLMISEPLLKDIPVLVYANKQDLPGALSPSKLTEEFEFATIFEGRKWIVIGSCATTGDGLIEGLDWLSKNASPKNEEKNKEEGIFDKATNYLSRLIYKPTSVHGETSS